MEFPLPEEDDPNQLLRLLASRLVPDDLQVIARADYGIKVVEHHRAVENIVRSQTVAAPLDWVPREVLQLTCWSNAGSEQAHARRAFSATAILLSDMLEGGASPSCGDIAGILAQSSHALGGKTVIAAAGFMGSVMHGLNDEGSSPLIAMAAVSLAMPLRKQYCDRRVTKLLDWAIATEDKAATRWRDGLGQAVAEPWLVGPELRPLQANLWKRLAREMEEDARQHQRDPSIIEMAALMSAAMKS